MTNEKFTPGPWRKDDNVYNRVVWAIDNNGVKKDYGISNVRRIARIYGGEQVGTANAALIAAAPEMYECVCDALTDLEMPEGMRAHFENVLKKARGVEE